MERTGLSPSTGTARRAASGFVAWERRPGYEAGAAASSDGLSALIAGADADDLGQALSRLPSRQLQRVLGAAVSPLSDADAATALSGAALHLEDEAAAALCGQLASTWPAEELLSTIDRSIDVLGQRAIGGTVTDEELHGSVAALFRLERRLVAERYRRIHEVNERRSYLGEGARSTADLLQRFGLTGGEAREEAETADALAELPKTRDAFAKGRIDAGKAAEAGKALKDCKRPRPEAPDDAAAKEQVDAERLDIDDAAANAPADEDRRKLRERLEAQAAKRSKDRLADKERRAHRQRHGRKYRDGSGTTIKIHGPGAEVEKLWKVLQALSRRTSADDERTPEQRTFDAAMHVADRYLAEGKLPDIGDQRAAVLLIATEQALHDEEGAEPAHVDGVGPVSSETARMLCCDAVMTVVVMGEDGQPLRVGRSRYRPNRSQRRAVAARDKGCVGCGAEVSRCQVHHIRWWRHGGPTDIENLVLLCGNCHFHVHHHGWVVMRGGDGRYRAGPPGGSGSDEDAGEDGLFASARR